MPCREHLVEVAGHSEAIDALGAAVRVISFGDPERVAWYREDLALPFPVVADPEREAYRAFGLERGSFARIWNPRVIAVYLARLFRGKRLRRPAKGEDLYQLGGDFVVAPDGRLAYVHPSRSPEDRPPATALLEALEGARDDLASAGADDDAAADPAGGAPVDR